MVEDSQTKTVARKSCYHISLETLLFLCENRDSKQLLHRIHPLPQKKKAGNVCPNFSIVLSDLCNRCQLPSCTPSNYINDFAILLDHSSEKLK